MDENAELFATSSHRCPGCGNRGLHPIRSSASDNLLCHRCGTCWHPGAQGLCRVDPLTCPGCKHRRICLAALAERSP